MANTAFYQLYYHYVWSTKGRLPVIKDTIAEYAKLLVSEDAVKRGAAVIACFVMAEHVHLLVSLPPTIAPSTFVGQVKGAVSHEFNKMTGERVLEWQEGYGVLSLRAADLEKVAKYVNNQVAIHARRKSRSILEIDTSQPDNL